jgi:tetratricopeptide (TPR) repeat protein
MAVESATPAPARCAYAREARGRFKQGSAPGRHWRFSQPGKAAMGQSVNEFAEHAAGATGRIQETGMKLTPNKLALLIAASGLVLSAPAAAQGKDDKKAPAAAAAAANQPKVSDAARKEIVALSAAVDANDTAGYPAKLAAAKAKAKSKDDQYVIAQLELKSAINAKNEAAMGQALQAVINSGFLPAADTLPLYLNIGKLNYNAKSYDAASAALEQVLKLDPNNLESTVMLAESRNAQGRAPDAVGLIQKAIAIKTASGQKAEENWYKRAVSVAYNAKLPAAPELARQWTAAYPSALSWRDTIRIFQATNQLDDARLLDTMRLADATGALAGETDYFRYANTLVSKGFAGEAKSVLDRGFAAKSISQSRATFSQLYTLASNKAQGDRASVDAGVKGALAAPTARQSMVTGEALYGYGDYQKAAELFRAALGKQGVDKDLANLRLGMALARGGDKAGATAALNAAGGAQVGVAKLWLTYLETKA